MKKLNAQLIPKTGQNEPFNGIADSYKLPTELKRLYIYLDIVESFSCEMCGSCCRNDWMVTMDAASFLRNRALFLTEGKDAEFAQAFIPITAGAGPGEYAYIAKKTNGACWFLEEDCRCRLHREAGHSHLDSVCQTFPRYPMNTARGLELTLSFSCPAVLRMAAREKPFTVIRSERAPMEISDGSCVAEVYPRQKPAENALRYYFELEQHFIDILQCRTLSLEERMNLLCSAASALDAPGAGCSMQERLNSLLRNNYSYMDSKADTGIAEQCSVPRVELLIENFFVNMVFKKIFYLYGLSQAAGLCRRMWHDLENVLGYCTAEEQAVERMAAVIADIELRYGHNRKAFLNILKTE